MLLVAATLAACDTPPALSVQQLDVQPRIGRIARPSRVLFIGNSFTYYNGGIHNHLSEMVRAAHPERNTLIDSLTAPNQTVQGHYRSVLTESALRRESWDVVVIQGASLEPVENDTRKEFGMYSALLAKKIRSYDAQVALFMTWAYRSRPSMIDQLAIAYLETGNNISALVVPVGLAWEQFRRQRSIADLYSDNRHPSMRGTYLATCVFYAALFHESPVGISYTAGLPQLEARYLQEIAVQTTQFFYTSAIPAAITDPDLAIRSGSP